MFNEVVLSCTSLGDGVELKRVQSTNAGAEPYSLIYIDGVQHFSWPTDDEAKMLKWFDENRKSILEELRA